MRGDAKTAALISEQVARGHRPFGEMHPFADRVAKWSDKRLLKENYAPLPVFRSEVTDRQRALRKAIGWEVMKRWHNNPAYHALHEAEEQRRRDIPMPPWVQEVERNFEECNARLARMLGENDGE